MRAPLTIVIGILVAAAPSAGEERAAQAAFVSPHGRDLYLTGSAAPDPPIVEVMNRGSEPVEAVEATLTPGSGVILTGASTERRPCARLGAAFRCTVGRLAPGARAVIVLRPEVRRVTTIRIGWMRLFVHVSARSTPADDSSEGNTFDLDVTEGTCTTALPGGGEVRGTEFADWLCGRRGTDRLIGLEGRDLLQGGEGDDVLEGGAGRDVMEGGAGGDRIYAEDGERDEILCGPGRDRVEADRIDLVVRGCERIKRF